MYDSGVVFRGGYARNVSRVAQFGAEIAGIGVILMFIRMFVASPDDRRSMFFAFISMLFVLLTCILNGEKNRMLWLGFVPLAVDLLNYILEMVDLNKLNGTNETGYRPGWEEYRVEILWSIALLVLYLLLFLQKNSRNKVGAVLFGTAMICGGIIFMILLSQSASEYIAKGKTGAVWREILHGLEMLCYYFGFLCVAIREGLDPRGKKTEETGSV